MSLNQNKPQKKQLIFNPGTTIEVRPEDPGFVGSWYEAIVIDYTVIETELYYEVEYKTLLKEDDITLLKERLKADSVRPIPPVQKSKAFKLNDIIEAYYLDGWWIGIINEIKSPINNNNNNNNVIVYEVSFNNPPSIIDFPASYLRVHLDWIDAKWVRPLKLSGNWTFGKCEDETIESTRKGRTRKIQSESSASPAEGADIAERQERDLTMNQINNQSESVEKSLKTNKRGQSEILGGHAGTENRSISIVKTPLSKKGKTLATSDQTGMHSSKRQRTQNADSSSGNVSNEVANVAKDKGLKVYCRTRVGSAADNHQIHSSSSSSDTQPPSLLLAGIFLKSTVQELPDGKSANRSGSEEPAVVSPVVAEGNRGEVINPNNKQETMKKAASVQPNDDNRNHQYVIDPNNEKREVMVLVSAAEDNGHLIDSYDRSLPFLKTQFNIWKDIESSEIFQAIPQKPHFQMLVNECPEACEGKAIGYMITYSHIAKKVTELRLDDPRGSIEMFWKILAKLENNGFDVKAIRDRLSYWLSKKDEYDRLLIQQKEHEIAIMEHNCEKGKILEEIGTLDQQLKEIHEKRDLALSQRGNMESEMKRLELKMKSAHEEIDKLSAQKQAAAFPLMKKIG